MKLILTLLLLAMSAAAQVTALIPQPRIRFFTNAGAPCNGCKVQSFEAGTTTPLSTYTTSTLDTPNSNPVILDSAGYGSIWLKNQAYKIVLKTSADVTLWTVDNIFDWGQILKRDLADTASDSLNSALVGYKPPGGTGRTVRNKLLESISVKDYGAVGDGLTDDTDAINSAITETAGKRLFFPAGTYCITNSLVLQDGSVLSGEGAFPRYGVRPIQVMPTKLTAGGACGGFPAGGYVIDARQKNNTSIEQLEIIGNGGDDEDQTDATSIGIGYGTDGMLDEGTSYNRNYLARCSIVRNYKGISAKQSTYFWAEYNNIAGNAYAGVWFENFSGNDSTFLGNYINQNNRLIPNVGDKVADIYTGAGMVFLEGSGSVSIIGGKIEWNATGVILGEWSQQVRIIGVMFDANSKYHVRLRSNSGDKPSYFDQATFLSGSIHHRLEGCHFQGGGYLTAIRDANISAHILIDGQGSETNSTINADIIGNTFRMADGGTDAGSFFIGGGVYSPKNFVIYGQGGGGTRARLSVMSNNMEIGAATNAITLTADFTASSTVQEGGNYGDITWTIGAGTFISTTNARQAFKGNVGIGGVATPVTEAPLRVYGGPVGLDYGEYIEVAPENGALVTNKLIGVDFSGGEDRTCLFVPGSATTANSKLCIVGLSGYTGIGAGNNTPASTLYVWDADNLNPTSAVIRQSVTQGTTSPLSVQNAAGTPKLQVRPDGSLAQNGVAFANLALWDAGTLVWCTDCNVATPCTGGGAGAWAFSSNGSWKCPF